MQLSYPHRRSYNCPSSTNISNVVAHINNINNHHYVHSIQQLRCRTTSCSSGSSLYTEARWRRLFHSNSRALRPPLCTTCTTAASHCALRTSTRCLTISRTTSKHIRRVALLRESQAQTHAVMNVYVAASPGDLFNRVAVVRSSSTLALVMYVAQSCSTSHFAHMHSVEIDGFVFAICVIRISQLPSLTALTVAAGVNSDVLVSALSLPHLDSLALKCAVLTVSDREAVAAGVLSSRITTLTIIDRHDARLHEWQMSLHAHNTSAEWCAWKRKEMLELIDLFMLNPHLHTRQHHTRLC